MKNLRRIAPIAGSIKYFKEKRVIDFKREETIKRIEQEAKQRERNQ